MSPTENKFYVYIYLNPLKLGQFTYGDFISFQNEPFYVGKGQGDRMYEHLNYTPTNTYNKFKTRTIDKIRKNGHEPIIIKLKDNLSNDDSLELECFYIDTIGRYDLGIGPLTNLTDGGMGRSTWSQEQKDAKSKELSLRFSDPKEREKQSEKQLLSWTEERRKEWSVNNPSRNMTEEQRLESSIKTKARFEIPGVREAHSALLTEYYKNNPISEEAKEKSRVGVKKFYSVPGNKKQVDDKRKATMIERYGTYSLACKRVMVNFRIYDSIAIAIKSENMTRDRIDYRIKQKFPGFALLDSNEEGTIK